MLAKNKQNKKICDVARYILLAIGLWLGLCCAALSEEPAGHSISFHQAMLSDDTQIHYAASGDESKPGILFIHGTPGNWNAFEGYLMNTLLQSEYFLVSVDRLGWGKSQLSNGQVVADFNRQADAVGAVLKKFPNKKWLIVGHSLGASIAPKIALKFSSSVTSLLLVSGSIAPALGAPRWFNRFANTKLVAWLLPNSLARSNKEIMVLEHELSKLETELSERQNKQSVWLIQGMRDRLVSPKNTFYAKQKWLPLFADLQVIELPDKGHFILWKQRDRVIQVIRELAKLRLHAKH